MDTGVNNAVVDDTRRPIDFRTAPDEYRHWRVEVDGALARLVMDVDPRGGLVDAYELKLNSYDLRVDIELYDAIQRLRFEHPGVAAVVITSGNARVFCAGANIKMLGQSSHAHKVNFCKFTNETRNAMEDASAHSQQTYICAINGPCAGGGYELALACDYIMLIDDGATTVALPELPLLAVLPGTGGLTRLVDKRRVRRDRADFFCTVEEGIRGQRALDWNLVDELAPASRFDAAVAERARDFAARSKRAPKEKGIHFEPLAREIGNDRIAYRYVSVAIDRACRAATITITAPGDPAPTTLAEMKALGADFWPLALARELDDNVLHLRTNEPEIGTWLFKTVGDHALLASYDAALEQHAADWFMTEIRLYLKRVLKRLDVTSRSLFAAIEPGSCFAGTLLEIALACDQILMLDGAYEGNPAPPATIALGEGNFGAYPMVNGLSRIASRFLADPATVDALRTHSGKPLTAAAAADLGLVSFTPDDIDWDDEIRLLLESRASFSPDALSGLEANLRFGGPETLESKIFARLSAWQNWIFQRPNAVGEQGALVRYGSGVRPDFDKRRV